MPIALAIFAVFIVVGSVSAIAFPSELLSIVRDFIRGPGLWWAAAVRLVLAVLLWFSAPVSHTPKTFRVLAVLALVAAVFIVVMDADGMLELIDWFAAWPLWAVRLPSVLGVAFGAFLLWSVSRKWTAA